jgi:hypothetical protein
MGANAMSDEKPGWGKTLAKIDLGLAVLRTVNTSGQCMTLADMADVCDCHPSRIQQIERTALRKMYYRLQVAEVFP